MLGVLLWVEVEVQLQLQYFTIVPGSGCGWERKGKKGILISISIFRSAVYLSPPFLH